MKRTSLLIPLRSMIWIVTLMTISSVPMAFCLACSNGENVVNKSTPQLLIQINLRQQQLSKPSPETLEQMKRMGMQVENLSVQRIFVYLEEKLTPVQVEELSALGVVVYLDSWIPPVGAHPTGFVLADMPVDKLDQMAEKEFIIKLDTAERLLEPQPGKQPQGG